MLGGELAVTGALPNAALAIGPGSLLTGAARLGSVSLGAGATLAPGIAAGGIGPVQRGRQPPSGSGGGIPGRRHRGRPRRPGRRRRQRYRGGCHRPGGCRRRSVWAAHPLHDPHRGGRRAGTVCWGEQQLRFPDAVSGLCRRSRHVDPGAQRPRLRRSGAHAQPARVRSGRTSRRGRLAALRRSGDTVGAPGAGSVRRVVRRRACLPRFDRLRQCRSAARGGARPSALGRPRRTIRHAGRLHRRPARGAGGAGGGPGAGVRPAGREPVGPGTWQRRVRAHGRQRRRPVAPQRRLHLRPRRTGQNLAWRPANGRGRRQPGGGLCWLRPRYRPAR